MSRLLAPLALLLAASASAQYSAVSLTRWRIANQGASNKRVLVSPNGQWGALVSSQNAVSLWQTATRAKLFDLHSESFGVAFSPDSRSIALGTGSSVSLYDVPTGALRWRCPTGSDAVRCVTFARDGGSVLFAGQKGRIGMIGNAGRIAYLGRVGSADLTAMALNLSGDVLAVGGADAKVTLLKASSGQPTSATRIGIASAVAGLAYSPDGRFLYGSEANGKVRRWMAGDDATSGTLVYSGVEANGVEAGEGWVAVAGGSAGAVVIDADSLGQRSVPLSGWNVGSVAIGAGRLWVGGNRSFASVHRLTDLGQEFVLGPRPSGASPVSWSADGRVLTSGDKSILAMAADDGSLSYEYRSDGSFLSIARSAAGGYEAYGSVNDFVVLRKVASNTVTKLKVTGMGNPYAVAFAPRLGAETDSAWLAAACGDKFVRLWNLSGGLLKTIGGLTSVARSIAVSPDGTRIATGDDGGRAVVFRVSDGQVERVFGPYPSAIKNVRYAPTGELLIGTSAKLIVVGATTNEITLPSGVTLGDFDVFGSQVAIGLSSRQFNFHSLSGTMLATVQDFVSVPNRVSFSPDGGAIAVQVGTTNVQVLANPLASRVAWIAPLAFGTESGDGTWLALQLSSPAPANGFLVALSSDSPNLSVPTSIYVPAGETYREIWIGSQPGSGGVAKVRAQAPGGSHQVSLSLLAPTLASVSLEAGSVKGGGKIPGRVRLSGVAPAGGVVVSLAISGGASGPATVTVPAGSRETAFQITTPTTSSEMPGRLTASVGAVRRQCVFVVTP